MKPPRYYRRRLPHQQPETAVFSLNFRLEGTLPKARIEELKAHRAQFPEQWVYPDLANYYFKFNHLLDGEEGPRWLGEAGVAEIVVQSLHYCDGKFFRLIAYSIMDDHVHVILDKIQKPLFRIMQSLKRHTGRKANALLGRTDEAPFWQKESYDHRIRSFADMCNQVSYVLNNPVAAGLVTDWRDHPFTWLRPGFEVYIKSKEQ